MLSQCAKSYFRANALVQVFRRKVSTLVYIMSTVGTVVGEWDSCRSASGAASALGRPPISVACTLHTKSFPRL